MSNYLYNGVELPDIESLWDKEKYPRAYIAFTETPLGDAYCLVTSQETPSVLNSEVYFGIPCLRFLIFIGYDWYLHDEDFDWNVGVDSTASSYMVWASEDILNEDGSVFFAATDPIPVNPAPTLDPTALLMGWQVGNRIRGGA